MGEVGKVGEENIRNNVWRSIPMGYNGKRSRGNGRRDDGGLNRTMARVLLFPALLVYLELVFHIYMKTALVYAPVYVVFEIGRAHV